MYRTASKPHDAVIGGKLVHVDSLLEERVLQQLEQNGFAGKWRRVDQGLEVGASRYTPDVELLIAYECGLHRALVEIKPYKAAFTDYHSRRFRGVRKYYGSQILLLYADREQAWFRIDNKTGELQPMASPVPGDGNIDNIRGPWSVSGSQVFAHRYRKRPEFLKHAVMFLADTLQDLIVGPKTAKRRRRSYRKQR